MTFKEAVDFLYVKRGETKIKLGLERITQLCELIGNPQNTFKSVHITGTNGKGSVTKALTDIFIGQGYTVGIYTSPHLMSVRERIRVNNRNISENDFVRILEEMLPSIEEMDAMPGNMSPSFFEIMTAMAFKYFAEKKVRFGMIEVGMGGRFDATNVLNSDVSVITTIQRDHMKILGETPEEIAFEKAGIIKNNNYVVLGDISESSKGVILRKAASVQSAKVFQFNKDYRFENPRYTLNWNTMDYYGLGFNLKDLSYKANGTYQPHNITVALAAAECLAQKNSISLNEEKLRASMKQFYWEGRFEILEYKGKKIVLEGAHNEDGAKVFAKTVGIYMPLNRKVAMIGILNDKDYLHMADYLSKLFEKTIITRVPSERSNDPKDVYDTFKNLGTKNISFENDFEIAFEKLLSESADYYFISGSLYLVGAIRALIMGVKGP